MSIGELTDRDAVLRAIAEYDEIGRDNFLAKYGFKTAAAFWVVHNGQRYDSKAIAGAAFGYQFPDRGPLSANDFSGGERRVQPVMERLGFAVEVDVTTGQISKWFRNLLVSKLANGRRAPHKPLLALVALRRLAEGKPRLTPAAEIAEELQTLLAAALPEIASPSPWEPIWRLEETVWELINEEGDPRERPKVGDDPPVALLRQRNVRCGLTDDVYSILRESPDWIGRIQNEIVERFLAEVPEDVISRATGRAPVVSRVWWVNQGQTYQQERDGGYVWAPTVTKSGHAVAHHTAVSHLRPSDVMVHYKGGAIRALSRVTTSPQIVARPSELPDAPWAAEGHRADVEYFELDTPIGLEELVDRPRGEGPFSSSGGVIQGYLFSLPTGWAGQLRSRFADRWPAGSPWAPMVARSRCLVVYVGNSSESNFSYSLPKGRWGWRAQQADYSRILPGDLILLALGFTGGSPRVQPDEFARHQFRRLVIARVSTPVALESEAYWPDETTELTYPYRLNFEVVEEDTSVDIADLDARFGGPVGDAFRLSALGAGKGVVVETVVNPSPDTSLSLRDVVNRFSADLRAAGYDYGATRHDELVRTFVTSLATKRFVILTGLSGSGKTKIAQNFGNWLGDGRLQIVAVRPDWTNPDPLLGYENGLSQLEANGYAWNAPEALVFILRAIRHPAEPHLLLLDEMNLAHVERYFADVLSGMESNHDVIPNLSYQLREWRIADVNRLRLPFPPNLFIVGTVNVDETTYMFSPKVLDRANTIEFRVETGDLQLATAATSSIPTASPAMAAAFLTAASSPAAHAESAVQVAHWMKALHRRLVQQGREFGHRTFAEATRFAELLSAAGVSDPLTALDLQVLQKVLPKYHGSIRELSEALNDLGAWCFAGPAQPVPASFDAAEELPFAAVLPRSFDKIHRMAKRLKANHFVSFAE